MTPKRLFTRFCLMFLAVCGLTEAIHAQPFVHPGGLLTLSDLDRMKTNVIAGNHPWIDDWNLLITDSQAQSNYSTHVQANLGTSRQNADLDAHAAYLNAVRWYISGNVNFANKATNILNAWAAAVNQVPSGTDTPGLIGIPIAHFAEAGEILRTYSGWTAANFQAYTNMMVQYLYPSCNSFLTSHNGACISSYWANWDACNIEAMIAMGVLCDNTNIYNQGVTYFKSGAGMGSISNAVPFLYNDGSIGQWQESGRDQEHAQLGVGELGNACQVAWNQGLDLFGFANNRLLAGAEYVASLNLQHPVPYTFYDNCAGANQFWVSINGLGNLGDRPVWELIYNHYAILQGLSAPNSQAMAQVIRPEHGSIDHFGYGTLTYTLNPTNSPYPPAPIAPAPAGLIAIAGPSQVPLSWTPPADSVQGYSVLRSTTSGGPYSRIASWNANTLPQYTDTSVVNGTTYYYVVAAINQSGTSPYSTEVAATPVADGALPTGWTNQDIGTVNSSGSSTYCTAGNNTFVVTGDGTSIGGTSDSFQYVYKSVSGNFTMVVRLSTLATKFGIMMRETLATNAAALTLTLGDTGDRESRFGTRSSTGGNMNWVTGDDYTWVPVWYRLQRVGNLFIASHSADGVNWYTVGTSSVPMATTYFVGMPVVSGTAIFDNVNDSATSTPPAAPANLVATAVSSRQINLSWTPVANAASYNILRSSGTGGPYTNLVTAVTATVFSDTTVVPSTTYYYVVSANGFVTGTNSAEAAATTPLPSVPPAPTGLTASSGTAQITLNWIASLGATSYNIKRAISGGSFTTLATGVAATYADTNVVAGKTYYYLVTAVNAQGESVSSSSVSAVLAGKLSGTIIGTPGSWSNLGNTIANAFDGNLATFFDGPDASGDWAGLDFGAGNSNLITQIKYCPRVSYTSRMLNGIFQGANNASFTSPVTLFTVSSTPASGVMTAAPVIITNAFRYVRYVGPANGNCDVAEIEFDGTPAQPPSPAVPTGLGASAGNGQVGLNWTASAGATGYNVKQSLASNGSYSIIASGITTTTFTNLGLANGTPYYFIVSALNAGGESANSSPVFAQPVSSAPPQLGYALNGGQLQFGWPVDHTGWILQMQTNLPGAGLGTNWLSVANSSGTNQVLLPLRPDCGAAFFRLYYP